MVRDLPSNIEMSLGDGNGAFRSRRGRKYSLRFAEELFHIDRNPALGFLVATSLIREEFPWLYELGIELYRASSTNKKALMRRQVKLYRIVLRYTMHGSMSDELMSRNKEIFHVVRMLEHAAEAMCAYVESGELELETD
jgi:hypothetical protein